MNILLQNKVITKVKIGGNDCHHMFGISYWNEESGAKLYDDIKKVYEYLDEKVERK